MPPSRTVIASRTLLAIDQRGRKFEVTIAIGEPYKVTEFEWACPASMLGLHAPFHDLHGVNSWQALQLAQQILGRMVLSFLKDGGRLLDAEEGKPISPEELFPVLVARA